MAFVFLDKKNLVIGAVVLGVIFSLGVIIGYYGGKGSVPAEMAQAEALMNSLTHDQFAEEKEFIEEVLENVDSDSIRSYLKELTKEPHIAGQERDEELTQWIKKAWEDMGLDHVELATYDFYLSWPNKVCFYTKSHYDMQF